MRKIVFSVLTLFVLAPFSAYAAIDSLNGLTDTMQRLVSPGSNAARTMHMDIVQVDTNKHRFRWDGSAWRTDQGGTGLLTSPSFGQLLVGDGVGGYLLIATSSLGISTAPGGSNGTLQFNDGGVLSGLPFVYASSENRIVNTVPLELWTFESNPGFHFRSLWNDQVPAARTTLTLDTSVEIATTNDGLNESQINMDAGQTTLSATDYIQFLAGSGGFDFQRVGSSGTTTFYFGAHGDSDSRACFNTKNTDGDDISFYFVGTTMVIEDNSCN